VSDPTSGDIRREAYRAAAGAVDRFLERVADPAPEGPGPPGTAAWDRFRSELARVVDLNLDIVRNAFDLYGASVGAEPPTSDGAGDTLVLGPGVPGSEATGVLWLHNFDEEPLHVAGLVGSRLSGPDGGDIGLPRWSFAPSQVSVPPHAALPVVVTVPVPPDAAGGTYRGTISATGQPSRPIEVRVDVTAMTAVAHDTW
jgi:hypothetical protein